MTNQKFYKTKYVVEVLSEDPIPDGLELSEVMKEAVYGSYSMEVVGQETTELNGKEAAEALIKQGSDPEFFMIDEEGNDVEDKDEDKDEE